MTQAEKKELLKLQTKKGRSETGLFLAEGVMLLEESLRFHYKPERVLFAGPLLNKRAEKLLLGFRRLKIPVEPVSTGEIEQLSEAETSQGLLGVFRRRENSPERVFREARRILFLDNLSDPGNAGTLIRSALAFGFGAVAVTNYSVEPYSPKVVRSSAGTIFGLPIVIAEVEKILAAGKRFHFDLWVAESEGVRLERVLEGLRRPDRILLAIGSEAAGLSRKVADAATVKVGIKHNREVDSLNAAVAGSIIMRGIYDKS